VTDRLEVAKQRTTGVLAAPRLAVGFLTRIPVGDVGEVDDARLRDATGWFPLVGAVVGLVEGGIRWGLDAALGDMVAAVLAVMGAVLVTGAFHEDGLADACDGLFGGWTPQRRIEIMRDSRLGTYGTVGLAGALLVRVGVLATLPADRAVAVAVTAHVVSRAMILVQIRSLPAASNQGSGAKVADPVRGAHLVVAALSATAALAWWQAGAIVALGGAVLGVVVMWALARRLLDGLTGDILGATQQLALLGTQLGLLAVVRAGADASGRGLG